MRPSSTSISELPEPVPEPARFPFVAWLASSESKDVSGRVWEVTGGRISVMDGYREEARVDIERRFDPKEIGAHVKKILAESRPAVKVYGT